MKRLLFILLLVWSSSAVFSQNDSIFPNYESTFCTFFADLGGGYLLYIDVYPSDPYTDTLTIIFDENNNEDSIRYADLWLDQRKIWVRLAEPSEPYWASIFYWYIPENHYPYEEFFLLYDFEHIDTLGIGDTVHNHYSHIYLYDIDTVLLHGEQKKIYVLGEANTGIVDYWMEGFGSLINPLNPLFYPTYINCGCGMDLSYYDGTDVTYDSLKYGDLPYQYICDRYANLESLVNEKVSIYPNPTKDKIEIKTSKNNQLKKIIISNIFGKVVQSETLINQGINEMQLDLSHLTNGIYLVHVWTNDSTIKTLKIIKN